jgi:RNA polymerase sigma-70 factor (ECF subfamily)
MSSVHLGDTSLGGLAGGLPETTVGLAERLRGDDSAYRDGLETLSRRYWKPVYLYARRTWAKTNDEAKDLAQGFFLWLLEAHALRTFDPAKGRFRSFLKLVLGQFIARREEARRALKRGGGVHLVSFEGALPELTDLLADPQGATPEQIFDRAWRNEIVNLAFARVRERHAGSMALRIYQDYDLAAESPTYQELATRYGISEGEVKRHLLTLREEVRSAIRAELHQLDGDHQAEWNELFGR